jgi:two-component system nitrate/nitrite response regulator NarL
MVDEHGRIRWLNAAAVSLLGDVRGRLISSLAAPDHIPRSREQLARKVVGGISRTDFGVATPRSSASGAGGATAAPSLTPRQYDVLALLAEGASTPQIASALGLAEETVRNHVRQLLRRLGVHSRLAAVAYARRNGLL